MFTFVSLLTSVQHVDVASECRVFSVTCRAGMSLQKKAVRELRLMFDTTAYFDSEQITSILMVRAPIQCHVSWCLSSLSGLDSLCCDVPTNVSERVQRTCRLLFVQWQALFWWKFSL